MKLELYKRAAIAVDLPEYGLRQGDLVIPVDEVAAADGSLGYAVEVFNAVGDTLDVYFIPSSAVEPLRADEVLCVQVERNCRRLKKAESGNFAPLGAQI